MKGNLPLADACGSSHIPVKRGFTLIEAVLAVGVFALLAVSGALLLFSTLRGAKKAAAASEVRNQGASTMEAMTQLLRYAKKNTTTCTGNSVSFTSIDGSSGSFSCVITSPSHLASGSAWLTSTKVKLVTGSCAITCPTANRVLIKFSLAPASATFTDESARINFESQVELRNR